MKWCNDHRESDLEIQQEKRFSSSSTLLSSYLGPEVAMIDLCTRQKLEKVLTKREGFLKSAICILNGMLFSDLK